MQLKTRTWFVISLLCFILAGYFWHLGNERYRRDMLLHSTNSELAVPIKELGANNFRHAPPPLLSEIPKVFGTNATNMARSNPLLTNRLSNTSKPFNELIHSDTAILLRNALIDTAAAREEASRNTQESVADGLNIPPHLRSQTSPGSYVVQSRGPLNDAFRAGLAALFNL